jgi:high-affinity K+ transport system ATPase subunit B
MKTGDAVNYIPYLIAAIGLCIQNGMNACKEVQPMIHLPQIPHGK